MAKAKMRWEYCQAVRRSGFFVGRWEVRGWRSGIKTSTMGRRKGGGRGVKCRAGRGEILAEGEVGDRMTMGRPMDAMKVMMEKTTREREPTRPISPRASALFFASTSGW